MPHTVLNHKIALVTGGARGIGAAIAKKLAGQGATVILTYSKSKDHADKIVADIEKAGGKAKAIQADANTPDSMPALAEAVAREFGTIDILVHNAGVFENGMIGEFPSEAYGNTFRINVESVFHLTNAALQYMKPGSRIVVISSVLGERAVGPGMSIYNASKFAATGFARSWAKDLGQRGILVNAVQPGPINTDMNPEDGEFADQMRQNIALGRYGKPEEIANAVAFLVGPDASYITGATLNVDGGMNA